MRVNRGSLLWITAILIMIVAAAPASAQNRSDRGKLSINFLPYEHNPVLDKGVAGAWDDGMVFVPHVVSKDGLFHLFYNGRPSSPPTVGIGYATSPDGFNFTKSDLNPILTGSGSGFDAAQVTAGTPLLLGDTWVLYYNARSAPGPGPGPAIGRATAATPTGPWTRDTAPVLVVGSPGEWDSGFITPNSIIATEEGYVMYYTAGVQFGVPPQLIGMATSPDGITWTKYHNQRFTQHPYAESTPVLMPGPSGTWDSRSVSFNTVLKSAKGWEMFYTGITDIPVCCSHQIGYATSHDGIHWTKYQQKPILTLSMDPLGQSTGYMEVPSLVVNGTVYYMYYDYGQVRGGIGAALGTVTRCPQFCDDSQGLCEELPGTQR